MPTSTSLIEMGDKAKFENPEWQELMLNFTLVVDRTFKGNEGEGFNATIFYKGKKAATINNMADGGFYHYYWTENEIRDQFEAFVLALPTEKNNYYVIKRDSDGVVDYLAYCFEMRQKLRRARKPKILFSIRDKVYEMKQPMTDLQREWIAKHYPHSFIWNDHL
jgi:hypothetical protein